MVTQNIFQFLGEALFIEQISKTDSASCSLIFIGRTYAAACGTNGSLAFCLFTSAVQGHMIRQYQRTSVTDSKPFRNRHTTPLQLLNFFQQCGGRKHNTVSNQTLNMSMQDSRRDKA